MIKQKMTKVYGPKNKRKRFISPVAIYERKLNLSKFNSGAKCPFIIPA